LNSIIPRISNKDITVASSTGETFTGEVKFQKTVEQPAYANTYNAAKTIDFSLGNVQTMPMTGNSAITLGNLREGVNILVLTNDGTAGRTATLDSTFGTPTKSSNAMTLVANEVNIISILKYGLIVKHTIEQST